MLVGALAFSLPTSKYPTVPVQPLQVDHAWGQRTMPRLVHPQHAVHALHRAAGTHGTTQYRRHLSVPLAPVRIQLLANLLLDQVGHMPGTTDRPHDRFPWPLPAQPPEPHQGITQFLGDRDQRQRVVHSVQEREALRGSQVVADPYPGPTYQARQGCCDLSLGPGSIVELAVGPEHRQRRCGLLPSRLDRLVASEALDHLGPGATRLAGRRTGGDPRSSGSSELILGLLKSLPVPLHLVPVDGQGLSGLFLSVEDVQGRSQGSLALLTSLLLSLGDPILQGLPRIGDHVLQGVPSPQLLGPDRAPEYADLLSYEPDHARRFDAHQHGAAVEEDLIEATDQHQGLALGVQPCENLAGGDAGGLDPAMDRGSSRGRLGS